MKPDLRAVLAPVLLATGTAWASAATPGRAPGQTLPIPAPQDRETLPLDWRLETLDGRTVTLAELAGRPVVVNAWATWCLPCVAELRSFEALAAALAGEEIAFVLVAPEEREWVAEWVARRGFALPFYVERERMPVAFGLRALPTTWILDRGGRLVARRRGAAEWNTPGMRALLRRLAAEGPG